MKEGEVFLLEGIARAPEDGPTAVSVQVALTRLRKLLHTHKKDMNDVWRADVLGKGQRELEEENGGCI